MLEKGEEVEGLLGVWQGECVESWKACFCEKSDVSGGIVGKVVFSVPWWRSEGDVAGRRSGGSPHLVLTFTVLYHTYCPIVLLSY